MTDLDTEFAYVTWADSCQQLYSPVQCCRRLRGHTGDHAAGYGTQRKEWSE